MLSTHIPNFIKNERVEGAVRKLAMPACPKNWQYTIWFSKIHIKFILSHHKNPSGRFKDVYIFFKTQIGLILEFLLNLEGYLCTKRKGKIKIKGLSTLIMFHCIPGLRSTIGSLVLSRRIHFSKSFLSQKPSSILFVLPTYFVCILAHLRWDARDPSGT